MTSNQQLLKIFIEQLLQSTDPAKISQIEILQRMSDDEEFKMAILVITSSLLAVFPEMFFKVHVLTGETLDLLINSSNEGTKH